MQTYLTEAEFFLNDRPLTYVYAELDNIEPITPFHLLFGRRLKKFAFENETEAYDDPDYINTYVESVCYTVEKVDRAVSYFKSRWRNEYLTSLRENHHQHGKTPHNVNVGDIVQIQTDNINKLQWNLGKIVKLHTGSDMQIR